MRTRVGYTGGTTKDPTYRRLGDHTESVQIDYDPAVITYGQLLDIFWASHSPVARSWSCQYKAAVFYHNEEQKKLALESHDRMVKETGGKVFTEVLPASPFYLAEDYHQKYYLLQVPAIAGEFRAMYPDFRGVVNSTAAARVNGYLGGYGRPELLQKDLDRFGLSLEAGKKLTDIVHHIRR